MSLLPIDIITVNRNCIDLVELPKFYIYITVNCKEIIQGWGTFTSHEPNETRYIQKSNVRGSDCLFFSIFQFSKQNLVPSI